MERAEQKAHSVADDLSYRADLAAERAEARIVGAARRVGERAAEGLGGFGLGSPGGGRFGGGRPGTGRSGPGLRSVLGAVALGLTVANRLRSRRHGPGPGGRGQGGSGQAGRRAAESWPDEAPDWDSGRDGDTEDNLRELD